MIDGATMNAPCAWVEDRSQGCDGGGEERVLLRALGDGPEHLVRDDRILCPSADWESW